MDYSRLVPSLEWCKKLAEKGLCQDKPELWWVLIQGNLSPIYEVMDFEPIYKSDKTICIAPTLDVLFSYAKRHLLATDLYFVIDRYVIYDQHLPDALAEAVWKGQP